MENFVTIFFGWTMGIIFSLCLLTVIIGAVTAFVTAVGWMFRKVCSIFQKREKKIKSE